MSEHIVQLYEDDVFLFEKVSGFIGPALSAGDSGIIIATKPHLEGIEAQLRRDACGGIRSYRGRLITLDARETLSRFMVDGWPDETLFSEAIGETVAQASKNGACRVHAFGEMVALLCAEGKPEAALRLEQLWNNLAVRHTFSLFCAYPMQFFQNAEHGQLLHDICAQHSMISPLERAQRVSFEPEQAMPHVPQEDAEGLHRVSPEGIIQWANQSELNLLGYLPEEYIGRPVAEFHMDAEVIDALQRRLLRGEAVSDFPARLRCKNGAVKQVLIDASPHMEHGKLVYTRGCTRDAGGRVPQEDELCKVCKDQHAQQVLRQAYGMLVTRMWQRTNELMAANEALSAEIAERKQAEDALKKTQYILISAQRVAHVGSWEIDVASGDLQCSDEFFRICGLAPQSVKPSIKFALSVVHPDEREATKKAIFATKEKGNAFKAENRIVRPDGSIRHVLSQGEAIHDAQGELKLVVGSILDITEHKKAEQALLESQELLRQLAAHEERIKEDERRRIAREIHDELGGLLTGINAYMSVAIDRATRAGLVPDNGLVAASGLANTAIETVRRVIVDLRPSVLDQLGVWSALEWYAGQVQERTGLTCIYAVEAATAAVEMGAERSIALFRIVQEALTNVIRHAQASRVSIRATLQDGAVWLEVEDDGKGIPTERLLNRESWGIVGMHERARYFGAELKITGTSGRGTVVALRVPIGNTDA